MGTKFEPAKSLATRQEELTSLVNRLRGDDATDGPTIGGDDFEALVAAAQDASRRGTQAELRQLVERKLIELDEARRRLKQGRYGVCQECGQEIPAKRLRAVPQATRCVDCQRRLERGYVRVRAA